MSIPKLGRREQPTRTQRADGRQTLTERADQVLLRLPVGVVVISRDYDIQMINTAARQQLAIHGTAVGDDFVHVARDIPSSVLRTGIDQARAGEETSTTVDLNGAGRGLARSLRLDFFAHRVEQDQNVSDGVVVVITDITEQRRAIGIRLALGAARGSILGRFLAQGLRVTAIACATGIVLSIAARGALSRLLFGVSPFDLVTLICAAVVVLLVATHAALIPATRAAFMQPMRTLREE